MGVAMADLDEDGHIDIVKTNFSDDVPNVYRNRGDGTFEDRVFQSGLGGYMQYVGWGIHLMDVDHDGRREILMVNGHVYPDAAHCRGCSTASLGCCTGTSEEDGSKTSRPRAARASASRGPRADPRPAISTTTARSRWS